MGVYHTSATALDVLADVKGTQFTCFTGTTAQILTGGAGESDGGAGRLSATSGGGRERQVGGGREHGRCPQITANPCGLI